MPDLPDFVTLERLKKYLDALRKPHVPTMRHYQSDDERGFFHQPEKRQEASLSSSATCIASLVAAGEWKDGRPWWPRTSKIAEKLLEKPWHSAGLENNNAFSVAFMIEGVLDLQEAYPGYPADPAAEARSAAEHRALILNEAAPILQEAIKHGYVKIDKYPASPYLTQLVYRVLRRLNPALAPITKIHDWAWSELNKQIALISANSRLSDPLSLIYALILARTTVSEEETKPEEKEIFAHTINLFFQAQKNDGSWPLSQPLFHYPKVGNAYCYEYELLTQLLLCHSLWGDLLPHIPKLERAALILERTHFALDETGDLIAWASGHHPQLRGPESWSTASVYHFAFALDRLVAEALRRVVFDELRVAYSPPKPPKNPADPDDKFADGFLDAKLTISDNNVRSLRDTLRDQFVFPIANEVRLVEKGRGLSPDTPMSAILFGPPGTSKTNLAAYISDYLGWPLLSVDPSYLVQEGLDKIQAQANQFFDMITITERVVVLLDEFDEMGRDRSRSQELLSRFITTAMLPKLISINEQRKIVFLLATNLISGFDAAFSRGGRFDLLVQVMPPKTDEKFTKWPPLKAAFDQLNEEQQHRVYPWIEELTFGECRALVKKLTPGLAADPIYREIEDAWKRCTLNQTTETTSTEKPTWKTSSDRERDRIRLVG